MEKVFLNKTIIAGNIYQLRKAANMTGNDLARKLHVSINTIKAWERGKTHPNLLNVLNLCNLFHIKVDDLIGVTAVKCIQ